MVKWIQLALSDFRNVFREQLLWFMFLGAPILQFTVGRFGVPWLIKYFPIMEEYKEVVLILLTVQVCSGIGFVIASILLDEKDEHIHTAIRVLPISTIAFIAFRLSIATFISFVFACIMIAFGNLVVFSFIQMVIAALLFAFITPLVTMMMTSFSKNKVEGLALFKVFNLLLLVPLLGLFVVPPIQYLFGILPMFWTYLYISGVAKIDWGWWSWGIGLIYHLGMLVALFKVFYQRFFD